MSKRDYPYYAGREKIHGSHGKRCCACEDYARFIVTFQNNWFRGDDTVCQVCEKHSNMARSSYGEFAVLSAAHAERMRQVIEAQHEETGRPWKGERRALPPRYHEVTAVSESGEQHG